MKLQAIDSLPEGSQAPFLTDEMLQDLLKANMRMPQSILFLGISIAKNIVNHRLDRILDLRTIQISDEQENKVIESMIKAHSAYHIPVSHEKSEQVEQAIEKKLGHANTAIRKLYKGRLKRLIVANINTALEYMAEAIKLMPGCDFKGNHQRVVEQFAESAGPAQIGMLQSIFNKADELMRSDTEIKEKMTLLRNALKASKKEVEKGKIEQKTADTDLVNDIRKDLIAKLQSSHFLVTDDIWKHVIG